MFRAGQQILLINMSGHNCFVEGREFKPGSRIEVLLAKDFDLRTKLESDERGPWTICGLTFEQIKDFARAVRNPMTREVLWYNEEESEGSWHDYADHYDERENTVVGTVKVLPDVLSPQLGNQRDILVYLPPSYEQGTTRYPVVYMHDGQNLFDHETSFGDEWSVDETLERASRQGLEAIVVGIPNMSEHRCYEYSPFADLMHGGGTGAAYLQFIVETIKPRIDQDFRTLSDREHTGILGSSMGGLISLFAFFHHADTFGFTGEMSPALWFADRAIFADVTDAPFVPGKLYLDVGTEEGKETLDDARAMSTLLQEKGYRLGDNLQYVEEHGAGHCETAWAGRLQAALDFLVSPTQEMPWLNTVQKPSDEPLLERSLGA